MANTEVTQNMPPQIAALPVLDLRDDFVRTRICAPQYRDSAYGKLRRASGRLYLRQGGWLPVGYLPDVPKAVLVCYPHTTNWDFGVLLGVTRSLDIRAMWVGKQSLFKPPFGAITRSLGGIAVNRGANSNQSQMIADGLAAVDSGLLAIAPEGTRHACERWKTGFWHIARAANVPLVPAFVDYQRRMVGFGRVIEPSADLHADFEQLAPFYAGVLGKFPHQQSPLTLGAKG